MTDDKPKTAVVTGASAGIGLVVARELARVGWRVIAAGRDAGRTEAAESAIRTAAPNVDLVMLRADLSVMAEVRRLAEDILARAPTIDLLVNNAGGTPAVRRVTPDGFEQCFAGNHLGPFLLTQELLPAIRRAGPGAQIINVASIAHRFVKDMQWDDLQMASRFDAGKAYAQSKLANLLFTRALARRLADDGVAVNAVHPGFVQSNFASHANALVRLVYRLGDPFALSPEQGADTILWLAAARDPGTGGYYAKRRPARLTPAASSDEGAERLWAISEKLVETAGLPSAA